MQIEEIDKVIKSNPNVYQILKNCPYQILTSWRLSHYKGGTIIFEQGSCYNEFCIISDGIINIYVLAENGKRYSQAIYHPGNMIGEMEIFDSMPYVCTVEAITDATIMMLPRDIFFRWLDLDRSFAQYILKTLANSFCDLSKKAGEDSLYSLNNRVCNFLLSAVPDNASKFGSYEIRIEKTLLSQQFAVTKRSLNRILQEFVKKGLIKYNAETIEIIDIQKLILEEKENRSC